MPYREREKSVDIGSLPAPDMPIAGTELEPETELLTINIGPHHPATHGVLRLLCTLEGETVLDIEPIVGYVHTGIEKSCEDQEYWKVIPYVERMDYLSYYFNAMAFCNSVEALLGEEVPPRAQYLRVIHMELNRIASHLFWLGTGALDLGAMSMLWWALRERDGMLDLFEMSSGQRMHTRYFQVGGVMEDIPPGWVAKCRKIIAGLPARIDQYEDLLDQNEIWLQRTKHTGVVSKEDLLALGVTGPLLRAAGVPWDLRKAMPYSSYDHFDFKIPVGTEGDNYDRYRVRLAEMRESAKIVEQALDGLPEGPYITTNRKVALPPRHELATSMEALIHHFKLVTEGFRVPPGEAYTAIESPRGELGCFVVADGSAKPARVHMRDPSFVNLQALKKMGEGSLIADFIASPGDARPDPGRGRRPLMASDAAARRVSRDRSWGREAPQRPADRGADGRSQACPWDRWPTWGHGCRRSCAPPSRRTWRATPRSTPPRCPRWPRRRRCTAGARRWRCARRPRSCRSRPRTCRRWPPSTTCCAPSPVGDRYVYVCTSVACHLTRRQVRVRRHRRGGARPGAGGRGGARVRVPGRVRHRADGLGGRPLRGTAGRERRARAGGRGQGPARGAAREGADRCLRCWT